MGQIAYAARKKLRLGQALTKQEKQALRCEPAILYSKIRNAADA